MIYFKAREKAKFRHRYNQIPHLTKDTIWESDKTQENITYKRDKRAGDQKAARNIQYSTTDKHKTQIKVKLQVDLNMFGCTMLILVSEWIKTNRCLVSMKIPNVSCFNSLYIRIEI